MLDWADRERVTVCWNARVNWFTVQEYGQVVGSIGYGDTRREAIAFAMTAEHQSRLIYAMIVAGKSANFADKAMKAFLEKIFASVSAQSRRPLPFEAIALADLIPGKLSECLTAAKTGNYTKLAKGIRELIKAKPDLWSITPEGLERFHGIGPKTSRFFVMWIRPHEVYAALDVHVLRWLRSKGHKAPKATPTGAKYAALEKIFIEEARKLGKTPRELDSEIWEAGAGRTQHGINGH